MSIFGVNAEDNIAYTSIDYYKKNFIVNADHVDNIPGSITARMMFLPAQGAFRAGVTYEEAWDLGNIGDYSVGPGLNTRASGEASVALGDVTVALGTASFASGSRSQATADASVAMGFFTRADGEFSTAMGYGTVASTRAETVVGSYNIRYTHVSATSLNDADRAFVVGTGISTTSNKGRINRV